ncbi:hypothetical protein SJI00_01515 [Pseudomonas sp. RP23018S]|uniref:hypothetical protein n=1 Tax=Pseudomonas sp. RP23018S TaxID=3096037 RepID=UPI002ACAF023|nr:hypothetical protein [Pseudomonas sp. RP23018S]MDZ5601463.1 hypothetical protein [Pseudomonas sp. RP23018S]
MKLSAPVETLNLAPLHTPARRQTASQDRTENNQSKNSHISKENPKEPQGIDFQDFLTKKFPCGQARISLNRSY